METPAQVRNNELKRHSSLKGIHNLEQPEGVVRDVEGRRVSHSSQAAQLVSSFVPASLQPLQHDEEESDARRVFKRASRSSRKMSGSLVEESEADDKLTSIENTAASVIQTAWKLHHHKSVARMRPFCRFGRAARNLVERYVSGDLEDLLPRTKAHLVLSFDVNKTILMADKAQDANMDFMVNVLLSECSWGRLDIGPRWVPVGRLATDRPGSDPELMTYRSFLDSFALPYLEGRSTEVEAENNTRKHQRQAFKRQFTEPGQPGEMFRGVFEALKSALQLPQELCTGMFAYGERRILPSFFNMLLHLDRQGRDFTLLFRTFGSDIMDVVEEINLFATGQHPAYPGVRMDGTRSRTDIRMSVPQCSGVFVRSSQDPEGTALLVGAPESVLVGKKVALEDLQAAAAASGGEAVLLHGFERIQNHLNQLITHAPGNRAYCLRDHYPFWKKRNERARAGKLMLLDPSARDTIHVFLDDNIGYTNAHIVDCRHARTGEPLLFKEVAGKNLVKAEPLNAVLDPQYYVRMVDACEMAVLREWEREDAMERATSGKLSGNAAGAVAPDISTISPVRRGILRRASESSRTVDLAAVKRAVAQVYSNAPFPSPHLRPRSRSRSNASMGSQVSRVSLAARQRWQSVIDRVLMMIRLWYALEGR